MFTTLPRRCPHINHGSGSSSVGVSTGASGYANRGLWDGELDGALDGVTDGDMLGIVSMHTRERILSIPTNSSTLPISVQRMVNLMFRPEEKNCFGTSTRIL